MSVTDDVSSQLMNKSQEGTSQAIKGLPDALSKASDKTVSGIVIIIKMPFLTIQGVMAVVGQMSHNPRFSKQNLSMEELGKKAEVKKIDEGITRDVMKSFDKSCRKYGVRYSAVVDKSDPKNPVYYVFFKGKETPVIEQALKEAYELYVKEQAKPRISVRAKLAFFHKRVAARDKQQEQGREKNNHIPDRKR